MEIEFIETQIFTEQITTLLDDESYRGLQNLLLNDPTKGDLIKGGGGTKYTC